MIHKIKNIYGFNIVELTITIVILAILSVIISISWPRTSVNVFAEAEKIAGDIRYTQQLSMARNARYSIQITPSQYRILDNANQPIVHFSEGSTTMVLPSGMSINQTITITFNSKGIPYNGSTKITSNIVILLTMGSDSQTITIYPETGYVKVT